MRATISWGWTHISRTWINWTEVAGNLRVFRGSLKLKMLHYHPLSTTLFALTSWYHSIIYVCMSWIGKVSGFSTLNLPQVHVWCKRWHAEAASNEEQEGQYFVGSIPAININTSKLIKEDASKFIKVDLLRKWQKTFFFWCLWSFQHCSNMCHGQRLVYSPIFAMVINPLIGIYNDLYLPTEKGFPYIPIMGWMTPHIPCFDKGTYVLISEMHTVRRKLGAQPKVLLLQADTRRLRWVSTGCCGQ
jgi:hypothetical protein